MAETTETTSTPTKPLRFLGRHFVRLGSIGVIADYVERFRAAARGCRTQRQLQNTFDSYNRRILKSLRLPAWGSATKTELLEADIMAIADDGTLDVLAESRPRRFIPRMRCRITAKGKVLRPRRFAGLAVYCLWASASGKHGVGVASEVSKSMDIEYFCRDTAEFGSYSYVPETAPDIYMPVRNNDYESIMSVAIVGVDTAQSTRMDAQYSIFGVLNLTSTRSNAFSREDCVWIDAIARLLGAMYQCYHERRGEMGKDR